MPQYATAKIPLGSAFLVLLLTALGTPKAAHGTSTTMWFGNDSRNAAMGNGGKATGRGPGNLLGNPAMMSFVPGGAWLSFSFAPNGLSIDLEDRPAGYNVPGGYTYENGIGTPFGIYTTEEADWLDRSIPTKELCRWNSNGTCTPTRGSTESLPTTYLINLAAIGSFGVPGLRVGIGITIPVPTVISFDTWYNDEREQTVSNRLHFERFGEFDNMLSIYPGVSYAPLEWLSLGITLKTNLSLGISTEMYLPQADRLDYAYMAPSGKVTPGIQPIAGIGFRLPIGLRFGAVYRHETYMKMDVDIHIRMWNVEEFGQNTYPQTHRLVVGFEPSELSFAVGYERDIFSVEVGASWQLWSRYLDRHDNHWIHPLRTGEDYEELPDGTQNPDYNGNYENPAFKDSFTIYGGGEVWVSRFAAVRAGLAYYPSPFSENQPGRYNYVDTDLLLYSLGAGFRFAVLGQTMTIDVAAQLWHMPANAVSKALPNVLSENEGGLIDEVPDDLLDYYGNPLPDTIGLQTNNPAFPGYTIGGLLFNASFMIGVEFN